MPIFGTTIHFANQNDHDTFDNPKNGNNLPKPTMSSKY